jgi:hypothetical protein
VPKVITKAIGNLVVDIATGELRKYVEERTLATMQLQEDPVIAKSDVATFEQLQKRAAVLQVRKRRRDAMRNARKGIDSQCTESLDDHAYCVPVF